MESSSVSFGSPLQMESQKLSRRKFIWRLGLGAVGLTALDAFGFEPQALELEQHEVPIRGLSRAFDGYKIALLSDFHLPLVSRNFVQRAIAIANSQKPDIFALPGDFVHGKHRHILQFMPSFEGFFDGITAPDGAVGTLGNHDHWMGAKLVRNEIAKHTQITLIDNSRIMLERGRDQLAFGGVGDMWMAAVKPDVAFDGVPDDVPRIMLSHNPDVAELMEQDVRVDLQLSGHTHGGEIRVPFGPAPLIPSKFGNKFREGLVQGKRNLVYVTRGIASVSRARLFCRPEVTVLTLRSA